MAKSGNMRARKVVPFLSTVEKAREGNRDRLVDAAKKILPTVLPGAQWDEPLWTITGGRLLVQKGKNVGRVTLEFTEPVKVSRDALAGDFAEIVKALVILRFNRSQQAVTNQRNFITAFGYVAVAARKRGASFKQIVPADFETALSLVRAHMADSTAYNLAKCLGEIAGHIDGNGLAGVRLDFKPKMSRPDNVNTIQNRSLEDPEIDKPERPEQMVDESVYQLIGKLFRTVPEGSDHRIYVLVLVLLACTGRRFSEIARIPYQSVEFNDKGLGSIWFFPRKASQGDGYTPKRRLWLPSDTVEIVTSAVEEAHTICARARRVASNMRHTAGPDLEFLASECCEARYFTADLEALGLSKQLFSRGAGRLRRNGLVWEAPDKWISGAKPPLYTTLAGIKQYCAYDYRAWMIQHVEVDQYGNKVYPEDLLFLQFHYLAGSTRAHWLAYPLSHEMVGKWIQRRLPEVAAEYAPEVSSQMDFNSHAFRHTMNHLLDEGGLSELIQTTWFGRSNPRDTKAYQHTSREKRLAMVLEELRTGQAGGKLAEDLEYIPVDKREAYLAAKVGAVHDVGTGVCVHDFAQTPCERHLQCQADCEDYVWAKDDKGRLEEIKRVYAHTKISRDAALERARSSRPRKSLDWIAHEDKKLATLEAQLRENGVEDFDVDAYLEEIEKGATGDEEGS